MNKTTYIIETSNTYDAAGTKLRKVAYDNSGVLISRTEYIGGIQYESLQPLASPPLATDLKFMSTGEGRVVKEGSNWNYEYYHKDHLGNTRVVYGYQKQVDEYKATMETPTPIATKEESQFYNIATRRITVFNHTLANINVTAPDRSAETNGNTSKAIGPAKMLQVSAGDRVQLEVFARYQTGTGGNNALISNLASAVTGSFLLNAGEAAHTAITNSVPTQAATISQTSGVPKSYLFYILFNSSYVYQQFGYVLVNSTAQAGHQQMYLDITVPTGGYLYTYVANESNVSAGTSVYFDDFTIVHTRNTPTLQVLQTSDYYPFGLQIAAGSYQKQTALDNDYLYNGKELQDEHNLGWLDYGWRMYDPGLARWGAVDNLAEKFQSNSPYHYAGNNSVRNVDVDGNEFTDDAKKWAKQLMQNVKDRMYSNSEKIAKKMNMIESGANKNGKVLSSGKIDRMTNQVAKLQTQNENLNKVASEVIALDNSKQMYDVKEGAGGTSDNAGKLSYDNQTGNVVINIFNNSTNKFATFAHEAKHAFQFETGKVSLLWSGGGASALADFTDEIEAYQRGQLFGANTGVNIDEGWVKGRGQNMQSGPIDVNTPTNNPLVPGETYGQAILNATMMYRSRGRHPHEVIKQ